MTGEIQHLADSDCTSERPLTELICNDGVHCYEWRPVYPDCSECRGISVFLTLSAVNPACEVFQYASSVSDPVLLQEET